ncbi:MAG: efflux RND transporter periplasmic adaptor subunit [Clostridium sp.]|nr:efflux RND transporter periplasmic adaptor subunit [Clostridium sp.]
MDSESEKKANKSLLITMGIVAIAVIAIAIIGFLFLNKPDQILEGQIEGTTVRISGKLPGRIANFYVSEGDTVKAGDTLVRIHSALVEAQLTQAQALQDVAKAQDKKIDAGTRSQIIQAAYELLQQAKASVSITKKTYERMQNLFAEGVISEQKRDEAKAAYDAAVAAQGAAESQYSLAKSGAQAEDKESAAALVSAAGGGVEQVMALLDDSYLTAPYDGIIDQIYPEATELVATGAPIISLLKMDDRYITFNVREDNLHDFMMGSTIEVEIPALEMKKVEAKVYYIRDMGSYATWEASKSTGDWSTRTFQVKARPEDMDNLRPGMSAIRRK